MEDRVWNSSTRSLLAEGRCCRYTNATRILQLKHFRIPPKKRSDGHHCPDSSVHAALIQPRLRTCKLRHRNLRHLDTTRRDVLRVVPTTTDSVSMIGSACSVDSGSPIRCAERVFFSLLLFWPGPGRLNLETIPLEGRAIPPAAKRHTVIHSVPGVEHEMGPRGNH